MLIFERLIEWLWILTGIGAIAVLVYLATVLLKLKNVAMGSYKRLSQPPITASKALLATVKGVIQQEKVRILHIVHTVKEAATHVKTSATEIKGVAQTIHPDELKAATSTIRQTLGFVSTAVHLFRSLSRQSSTQSSAR